MFNPAAIAVGNEVFLLLRVAEAPRDVSPNEVAAIYLDGSGTLEVRRWSRHAPGIDASDPRVIRFGGEMFLTSISHLRLARSSDGLRFTVDSEPCLFPSTDDEAFGIEDARVVFMDGEFVVNYTAVSSRGIATALATGPDLRRLARRGVIFSPPNRDVTLFPERIGGRVAALHRPMPEGLGHPAIWYASSADLLDWGDHRFMIGRRPGAWDDLKVGGGAPPIRVRANGRDAWLAIYHGVTEAPLTYSLGALLLDAESPWRVLGRSRTPILTPETQYERKGFLGNVVFTCGVVHQESSIRVYYGASDGVTAVADIEIDDIIGGLE